MDEKAKKLLEFKRDMQNQSLMQSRPQENLQSTAKQGVATTEPVSKIGKERVRKAIETLKKYKVGKANLERRIIENEQWYKLRHWQEMAKKDHSANDKDRPQPASAWLFNSIANKHADAMDNYPEPAVLPREETDRKTAGTLSSVLPVLLERGNFEDTYSDAWWYKLKFGTCVYGVFWDNSLEGGLGDIAVKQCDILNLFWEPGIKDIQQSRNFFHTALCDNDLLKSRYPEQLKTASLGGGSIETAKYIYDDSVDTSEKSVVVDWYYKVFSNGHEVLHYCKFVNDTVLYASENEQGMENGFYEHGEYPFVFDTLFVVEGTPCGYGYIDIMKDSQMYIDELNQALLEHTVKLSRKRFWAPMGSVINEEELLDWSKPIVHYTGNGDGIKEFKLEPLDGSVVNALQLKIDELKETSGNRDFSQGGTTSGVTAASAIAALQEAGSKLSRDMLKSSYRAFTRVNRLIVELIRQFYTEPRCFRITGEMGEQQFAIIDNGMMKQGELKEREPVFDINVTAQRKSSFARISQNELAKEMYNMGFFNPQLADQAIMCIDMMDFEGKENLLQKIQQNSQLLQQFSQMAQTALQLAKIVDAKTGSNIAEGLAQRISSATGGSAMPSGGVSAGGTFDFASGADPAGGQELM